MSGWDVVRGGRHLPTFGKHLVEAVEREPGGAAELLPFRDRLGGHDHARGDRVALIILAKLDPVEAAGHRSARLAVLHVFDRHRDVAVVVAADRDLSIIGARQASVSTRTAARGAAMVDDENGGPERATDGVGRPD